MTGKLNDLVRFKSEEQFETLSKRVSFAGR